MKDEDIKSKVELIKSFNHIRLSVGLIVVFLLAAYFMTKRLNNFNENYINIIIVMFAVTLYVSGVLYLMVPNKNKLIKLIMETQFDNCKYRLLFFSQNYVNVKGKTWSSREKGNYRIIIPDENIIINNYSFQRLFRNVDNNGFSYNTAYKISEVHFVGFKNNLLEYEEKIKEKFPFAKVSNTEIILRYKNYSLEDEMILLNSISNIYKDLKKAIK